MKRYFKVKQNLFWDNKYVATQYLFDNIDRAVEEKAVIELTEEEANTRPSWGSAHYVLNADGSYTYIRENWDTSG